MSPHPRAVGFNSRMSKRPLFLVSITPAHDSDVTHLPLLQTRWLAPPIDLHGYEGIIFTSKNGVEALERIAPEWKALDTVCVGKATALAVTRYGGNVIATAGGYGDDIAAIITQRFADRRWLYARPKKTASDFAAQLRGIGITLDETIVYETVCADETPLFTPPDNAVIIFTSPSALHCFKSYFTLKASHALVVIGRTTKAAAEGYRVHLAPEPTLDACVALARQLT